MKVNLHAALLAVVLATAALLRLAPTLTYGVPYSLDAWPLIRDSQILISNPEVRIWDDSVLDGYNNRWPGTIIITVLYSLVTDLKIVDTYRFFGPLTSLLTILLVYLMLKRVSRSSNASAVAVGYFAFAPSLLVFTSATIKEVCAYPLLYSFLLLVITGHHSYLTEVVALAVLAAALSETHHLASIMATGLVISALAVYVVIKVLGRYRETSNGGPEPSRLLTSSAVISIIFPTYYVTYGSAGFRWSVELSDVATYIFYALLIYFSYALVNTTSKERASFAVAVFAVAVLLALTPFRSLLPGLPPIKDPMIAFYVLPAAAPLIFTPIIAGRKSSWDTLVVGAFLLVAVNTAYISLAKPEFSGVFHRVANYLILANTLLLSRTLVSGGLKIKLLAGIFVLATVFSSLVVVWGVVNGGDSITYYWTYRGCEVRSLNTISHLLGNKVSVVGDVKVAYFYETVLHVDTSALLRTLLDGKPALPENTLVILYRDNILKGYVISPLNIISLQEYLPWINGLSKVYDGRELYAFTG